MYLSRLVIENFRCISKTEATFPLPDPETPLSNMSLILGNNGSGKSTILKAIALAVLGGSLGSAGFRPYYLVRRPEGMPTKASLNVTATLHTGGATKMASASLRALRGEDILEPEATGFKAPNEEKLSVPDELYLADSPQYFLCGYGSNRHVEEGLAYNPSERDKGRSARYQRVVSLFEERAQLRPFSAWLLQLTAPPNGRLSPHHDDVIRILRTLLKDTGIAWTSGIVDGEAHFVSEGEMGKRPQRLGNPVPGPRRRIQSFSLLDWRPAASSGYGHSAGSEDIRHSRSRPRGRGRRVPSPLLAASRVEHYLENPAGTPVSRHKSQPNSGGKHPL